MHFATRKPLAVVTTMTRWHEPPRIRHQVTRQLLRFFNVLYVELASSVSGADDEFEKISDDLIVFRPPSYSWWSRKLRANVQYFRARHGRALAKKITAVAVALGPDVQALVSFQFDFPEIFYSPVFKSKIYLCNDEFQDASRFWTRGLNRRSENAVIAAANVSLAVSLPLLEKLKRATSTAELFLPGHEFEDSDQESIVRCVRQRDLPIRVCYMGYLNDRLRMDWLSELATDSQIKLSLIGPIEGRDSWVELLARDNVEHHDTLIGPQLQRRLQQADVFVMPYDVRQPPVQAITAPNKLFQYLACGRPVVCSNLPRLIGLPETFIYVACDAAQFSRAVHRAFAEDNGARTSARLAYASQNTWTVRGDRLRALISRGAF